MSSSDDVYFINADPAAAKLQPGAQPKVGRRSLFGRRASADATLAGDSTVAGRGDVRPALAATLSMFLCGAGQLYNGRRDVATLYLATEGLVLSLNWCLWKIWVPIVGLLGLFGIQPTDVLLVVAAGNYVFLLFIVGNALQAFRDATAGEGAEGVNLPIASALTSLLLPGWGQFLNGQPRKAALLQGLFLTGVYAFVLSLALPGLWRLWDTSQQRIFDWSLSNGALTALAAAVVVYLVAFWDAVVVARRQRVGAL